MNTKFFTLTLTLLLSVFLSGCFQDFFVEGNGDVIEEVRTVPEFDAITSSGSFNVYYEYADDIEVTVSCESNIMMYIETVVYNNELKIRTPYNVNIRPHEPIDVYVKGPYVNSLQLSGSGTIETDTIYNDRLAVGISGSGDVETAFIGGDLSVSLPGSGKIDVYAECDYTEASISGSGEIKLEGAADGAHFKIPGSGQLQAYGFPLNELVASISGSGTMYVNVQDYLEASISGSGNVYYIGNPELDTNSSGSGNVVNKN